MDLASGVGENTPPPDLKVYNPLGPEAMYERFYRSSQAIEGAPAPGLSAGWTDNLDFTVQGTAGEWAPLTFTYPNGGSEKWTPPSSISSGTLTLTPTAGAPYIVTGVANSQSVGEWNSLQVQFLDSVIWTFAPVLTSNPNLYFLHTVQNPSGGIITIDRDPTTGRPTGITNGAQPYLLTLGCSGSYLQSITDCYGRTVTYTFGSSAGTTCLAGVSQIGSSALQWGYGYSAYAGNGAPLLSSVGQPDPRVQNGPILSHAINYYTVTGMVSNVVDADGDSRTYRLGPGSTIVTATDPGGGSYQITRLIGALNEDAGSVDAAGNREEVQYTQADDPYKPTSIQDGDHNSVGLVYDIFGRAGVRMFHSPTSASRYSAERNRAPAHSNPPAGTGLSSSEVRMSLMM